MIVLDILAPILLMIGISRTTAAIGTLANIKPIIMVTPDGKISVPAKCIGIGKAIAARRDTSFW